ncbi:MAG: M14 metallopeptidase family protein [Pricia sp.]
MPISLKEYKAIYAASVQGRYVTYEHIKKFIKKTVREDRIETVGESVLGIPIKSISLGIGPKKILMWSQMHGNESTTTKAVLDLMNYLEIASDSAQMILDTCTIVILPMLNPDGAAAYTRVNANEVDLNRDARQRTQPESIALRKVFDSFQPDFCFNLHDQRTIFNVGDTPKPATVSFLAPAHDEERSVSPSRAESMRLIVAMNAALQQQIPGQIGRYDDAFNADCVGDTFQMTGTPTILFEAGHFYDDYEREHTRKYVLKALITALRTIGADQTGDFEVYQYAAIPENGKLFLDVVIHNSHVIDASLKAGEGIGILYVETLRDENIVFEPRIEVTGDVTSYYGHETYNALDESDLIALKGDRRLRELLQLF